MKFKNLKSLLLHFLVVAFVQTTAYAKKGGDAVPKVSITVENLTLNNIFSALEEKTEYHFNYGEDIITDSRKFSLSHQNATLEAILSDLSDQAHVHYSISGKTVLIKINRSVQDHVVTGKVVDAKGIPLLGASILEKGSNNGVATNFDGEFTIALSSSTAVLVVTYVGFIPQEIPVTRNTTTLDIVLEEDAQSLDEVVVTALGITKAEKKIGYATQEIEMTTIEEVNAPNLGNLLSGQIAGLTVTNPTGLFQAPEFSLRGKTPLIVIDGIPVETNFFDITANDIADINVLKGTTASALYGSRGRNGAVLITTKNASAEGLEITLSHSTLLTAGFTVYPDAQTEYGSGSNGKYEFWDGRDGGT